MDVEALARENTELKTQVAGLTSQVAALEEQVKLLQSLHFGPSSEKLTKEDKKQASLFNEAEDSTLEQDDEKPTETREIRSHTRTVRTGSGRKLRRQPTSTIQASSRSTRLVKFWVNTTSPWDM